MTRAPAVALAVATALVLAACSGTAPDPLPSGTTATTAAPAPSSDPVAELTEELAALEAPEVLATAEGSLPRNDGFDVVAEVLSVTATKTATVLQWQLSSADGQSHDLDRTRGVAPAESARSDRYTDVRDVRVVDPGAMSYSEASLYTRLGTDRASSYCLCSDLPTAVGAEPVVISGVYAPLEPDVAAVDVHVPGLPAMEDVPVTR